MDEDALGEFAGKGKHFLVLKRNSSVGQGKERIIGALLDVLARVKFGTALADNNLSGMHNLTAKPLDTKPLRNGIASELCRTARFTMCHKP